MATGSGTRIARRCCIAPLPCVEFGTVIKVEPVHAACVRNFVRMICRTDRCVPRSA
jgi:hypothetical protein